MRNILFVLLASCTLFTYSQKRNIELTDIWSSGTFYPKTVSGFVNINDGKSYCVQERDESGSSVLNVYSYTTGEKVKELFNASSVFKSGASFSSYTFNSDQSKVLIYYSSRQIYRNSSAGKFLIYDLNNKNVVYSNDKDFVRYPTMNPDGSKVAFVKGNNLYIVDVASGKSKQVTQDGENNKIINGAVDWVYEEEFAMSRGFEWNADGTKIAFYRFDESAVKQWQMTTYGKLYPDYYKFKYPKAGEDNSVVQVFVTDMKGKCKEIELGAENDQYLPRLKWTQEPNVLSVQRLNRLQNHWELLMVNGTTVELSVEENDEAYVEVTDEVYFLKDKEHMILSSEKDGYKHLYFHKVDGPQIHKITNGKWDVDRVLGIDEQNQIIYFTSSEVTPTERHIYSIDFLGKKKTQLTTKAGWHSAQFSKDFSLSLHNYTAAGVPRKYVIRDNSWKEIRVVEDNQEFKDRNSEFILSEMTFDQLEVNGESLNYWMIKPSNFDESKKYPLLMYVYGGPGSQTVKNSFGYSNYYWYQMLANKHNIIIVSVDNRGTGARGSKFKKMTYKQLGKYETEDQISAAKSLSKLDFINENRIGIWGWSYGGYMSSLGLAKGNDIFKMAIAVAPVTNWRYYDNIYTERYMALPQQNGAGYDDNSPINFVKDIKGKYLIVHGTGDDNVHFQNSVMMVNEMIKNNIPFDSEFYPNKNHSIYGGQTRLHLYTKMTNFILENL
jgi:dipeptidyl-peptidase-4